MTSPYAVACALWLSALGVSFPSSAAGSCPSVTIDVEPEVAERWPELSERIRRRLATSDDLDRCARVGLAREQGEIRVEVSLPDGRVAARAVSEPEDVFPILHALLLVPDSEPGLASSAPPPKTDDDAKPTARRPVVPRRRAPAVSVQRAAPEQRAEDAGSVGVELSVITAARVGDGQTSLGLGALSFLDVSGWLAGFQGRADSYNAQGRLASPALTLLGGHRFRLSGVTFDVVGGPGLALDGNTVVEVRSGRYYETTSVVVPRCVLASHVNFSPRSALRSFVGIQGDVGFQRSGDAPRAPAADVDHLPSWMIGLTAGITVGTR